MLHDAAVDSGRSWAYLVGNRELAKQTEESLAQWLPKAARAIGAYLPVSLACFSYGEVWRGSGSDGEPGRRYEEFIACRGGLLVDEVHQSIAVTRSVALFLSRAVARVGMSATPLDRGDGLGHLAIGLTGPELGRVEMSEVAEAGYLTPGRAWCPEVP